MNSRTVLAGAGCGVLATLSYTNQLLSPNHYAIFFHQFPLSSVYSAVFLDLIGVGLAAALVFALLERLNGHNILWPILTSGIIVVESYSLSKVFGPQLSRQTWLYAGMVLLILAFVVRSWDRVWFSRVRRGTFISLALVGCSILWIGPELLYLAVRTSSHEAPGFRHLPGGRTETLPRVVWIIFDELSQDQVFDHRWPGLELPNFDRLRGQAVSFSNVEPAALLTRLAIPSLLLGRPVSRITTSATAELTLYFADTRNWQPFSADQTIFAEARRLGWTTGVFGWSAPYCRFLGDSVDDCYWLSDDEPVIDKSNLDPHRSMFLNASYPVEKWVSSSLPRLLPPNRQYQSNWVASHQQSYQVAMEHALSLIRDQATRFTLIHLPVPHPPAIYSRKEHRFSAGGSYLDNLALADLALGRLLDALQATPGGSETTLIVCGDHSWRPYIWQQVSWTAEDQAASKGLFDPRPVLLIHLPGERAGSTVPTEYKAFALHDVMQALLRNEVHSTDDLISEMRQPGSP